MNNFLNYEVIHNGRRKKRKLFLNDVYFIFFSIKCHDEGKQEFIDYKPIQVHQCVKCNKPIEKTQTFSYYEEKTYHNECFTCNRCGLSLVNKPCHRLGSAIVCPSCN